MDEISRSKLLEESAKGRRAEAMYKEFLEPFFKNKEEVLIEAFRKVSVTDSNALTNIRMQFKALDALNDEMKSFIQTGKLASTTLLTQKEETDDN